MAAEDNELEGVPNPGDVIVDKYRVDRVLGVGGMGCVVAAMHLTLDQPVAIKFLLAKVAKNPKHVVRFQREAQAAARIKNDHVAKVSDVGTLPDGTPYMVMEYLDGEDLADRLRRGPLQPQEAIDNLLQACEALTEAHQLGIVHRDLKPANLFLARQASGGSRVKVLDFGISKIISAPGQGADLTKTSALMGSPLYMSPEQMMSAKAADTRTDIWALGCILFEALTCQPPFIGDTLPEICSRILAHPPTKLRELMPSVPPELEAVIERTLTKEPNHRYQNLGQLADALLPFAGERGRSSINVIRRQLGQPELSLSHSRGSFPPPLLHPTHPGGGYAASHLASSAAQSGSVSQSGPQPALGAPSTFSGQPGSHPETYGPSAMLQGASTAAPVAQTMSDGFVAPRRRRMPLLLAIGALVLGGLGTAVFFGIRGTGDSQAATESTSQAAEPTSEPTSEPVAVATSEEEDEPTPPVPDASSAAALPPPQAPAGKLPTPVQPPPPPPASEAPSAQPAPPVGPAPQPATPTVRPGDDKFNTFNP